MEEKYIKRLLIQFNRLLKQSNRKFINPNIEEIAIDDLKPLTELVAKSRAEYLKYVYDLSKLYNGKEEGPSTDELKKLKTLRVRFEELATGAKAFETSIERGYLDLKL